MEFKNDVKGHGFIRKYGKKVVSGIALAGAVVLFGGVVSADEVANSTSSVDNTTTKVTPVNGTEAVEVSKNPTYTTAVPVSKDLTDSVSEAKNSGLVVNETETKSVESEKKGQEDYAKQSDVIDKTVDDYNKQVADYNKATNVATEGKGDAESVTDAGQYNTWQKVTVNNDGTFTSVHDLNDGISSFATGTLNGKLNYTVSNNGDGSEKITIASVDLDKYDLNVTGQNLAVNKNINYIVKDLDGNVLYSKGHDGSQSFNDVIGKTFTLNKVFNVKDGQSTDWVHFLNIDDTWIYNTAGQLFFKLKNTNEKPSVPTVSWHKNTYEKPLTVKKEVTDKDGKDVNHETVKLGDVVKYPLTGSLVDVSAKPLYRYGFTDYLDTVHDEYQGYMAELTDKANVTLKTGEKVTDEMLRQNVTVSYDGKTGKWDFDVNKDFLSKLSSSSKFQVKAVISALRVKAGDSIKNDVFHYVNDDVIYFGSVETKTPENPKPVTPVTPVTPVKDETVTPVVPLVEKAPVVEKQAVLPQTGEKSTVLALVSGIVLFVFGMFGLKQSKKN
ncbi:LPXTG cell wall anchor domain-containing protein [Streptococcus salivarius]|uniref:LPXTG cell wall anchor domain-containing protein n=1 Tax=Streptococcus salivarius TaxID=1304 RepID=UPI0034A10983